MDEHGGHYANKPDREKQMLHGIIFTWNLQQRNKQKKDDLIETESRMAVAEGWGGENGEV